MDIKEIKSLRTAFLLKLYDVTGGDRWQNPIMYDIGKAIGIDQSMTDLITDYLNQKGLLEINTKERDISITTIGIDEAESYYCSGDKSMTRDDIRTSLDEINRRLDLLSLGQEILYEDIMGKLESRDKIQMKDLKLVLISTLFSRGLDALRSIQLIEFLK